MPTPSLPDLPPNIFAAIQAIGNVVDKTPMTRMEYQECANAIQVVFQFCVQGHKAIQDQTREDAAKVDPDVVSMKAAN